MKSKGSFLAILFSFGLLLVVLSCAPALRLRNSESVSLSDKGYTRYQVAVGDLSYDILKLKNGGATLYQNLTADGDLWVNTYRITASTNEGGGNAFTLQTGSLLPEANRKLFERGTRYVWDIGTTVSNSITAD